MTEAYTPQTIEPKWHQKWAETELYKQRIDKNKPKHYALTMLPYPSGDLHIGHWYAMTPSDARARYMRMKGYNVLFPMGFDAFGLPAENAAIARNIHPAKWTFANIARMRNQLRSMGAMFDWEREAVSAAPDYYRWTQWFFKKLMELGLAYRKLAAVDFCPKCNTTWPVSRCGETTAIVNGAAHRSSRRNWSNGSSKQPIMLKNCSILVRSIGRNGSR